MGVLVISSLCMTIGVAGASQQQPEQRQKLKDDKNNSAVLPEELLRAFNSPVSPAVQVGMPFAAAKFVAAISQIAKEGEEEIELLIVMVQSKLAGEDNVGAGIIVGVGSDSLYIVTANHVVRRGTQEALDIQVQLKWLNKPVKASLLKHADAPLDLAVLSIAGLKQQGVNINALPFDHMGDAASLQRGEPVYSLGNARVEKWSINVSPDKISKIEKDFILYESNFIGPGHSGGALLNDRREVIGMLLSDAPPNGRAISITSVLSKLKGWGLPVNLRAPNARVSAGGELTCQVAPSGAAHCWGNMIQINSEYEEQGFNFGTMPIQGIRFKSISVGKHVCGIAFNSAAYCFGRNGHGQLGNGSKAGSYKSALPVQGGLRFLSVSAGFHHTCGITVDGSAYCWGSGQYGKLGNDSNDGSVVPVPVSGGLTFKSLSAGFLHTCGVTTSGVAHCWGSNEIASVGSASESVRFVSHEPLPVTGNLTFKSISAGYSHTCALTTNGAVYCWGGNEYGQLGNNSNKDSVVPVPVAGQLNFKSVSAAIGGHACGITTNGAAYCWGWNSDGQLGNGSKKDSSVPVAVAGGLIFESISAGHFHTCGVTTDGSTYCWGGEGMNGAGTGTKTGSTIPVRVLSTP